MQNEKVIFTISLLGYKDQYFGIKATSFYKEKLAEKGVFFKINSMEDWALNIEESEEFIKLSKIKKNDKLKYYYTLPKILEN